MFQRLGAALLSAAMLMGPMLAQAQGQTDAATAEALMRQSGLWEQLASIAPQVRQGMADELSQLKGDLGEDERARMLASADTAFAADRLRASVLQSLQALTAPQHVPALKAWYGSPSGQAISRAEAAMAAQGGDSAASAQAGAKLLARLPARRRAMLDTLVQVSHAGESLTTMVINLTLAMQMGAASVMPDAPAISPADLRASLEAQRPRMQAVFAGVALSTYAQGYVGVSDPELGKYVAFLSAPAGQHFTQVAMKALDEAMSKAASEWGRALGSARQGART